MIYNLGRIELIWKFKQTINAREKNNEAFNGGAITCKRIVLIIHTFLASEFFLMRMIMMMMLLVPENLVTRDI